MIDERLWLLAALIQCIAVALGILSIKWLDGKLAETVNAVKWYNGQIDLMKARGIYTIVCTAENATYLGSTEVNFHVRWGQHIAQLERNEHPNCRLQEAWNKYGAGAFHFYVAEPIDDIEDIRPRETEHLEWRAMNLPARQNYNVLNSRMRNDVPIPQLQFVYPTRIVREATPATRARRKRKPATVKARP